MNKSESIVEISKALVKAQSKMGGAVKGSSNPFFKSKYSDLNSVIEACKQELNNEGISVLQPIDSDEHGDYVETVLIHTSGEFVSSKMRLKFAKENDMQAYGSSISYARRYSLQSLVFIPSSEDDDGEKTTNRTITSAAAIKATAPFAGVTTKVATASSITAGNAQPVSAAAAYAPVLATSPSQSPQASSSSPSKPKPSFKLTPKPSQAPAATSVSANTGDDI